MHLLRRTSMPCGALQRAAQPSRAKHPPMHRDLHQSQELGEMVEHSLKNITPKAFDAIADWLAKFGEDLHKAKNQRWARGQAFSFGTADSQNEMNTCIPVIKAAGRCRFYCWRTERCCGTRSRRSGCADFFDVLMRKASQPFMANKDTKERTTLPNPHQQVLYNPRACMCWHSTWRISTLRQTRQRFLACASTPHPGGASCRPG